MSLTKIKNGYLWFWFPRILFVSFKADLLQNEKQKQELFTILRFIVLNYARCLPNRRHIVWLIYVQVQDFFYLCKILFGYSAGGVGGGRGVKCRSWLLLFSLEVLICPIYVYIYIYIYYKWNILPYTRAYSHGHQKIYYLHFFS